MNAKLALLYFILVVFTPYLSKIYILGAGGANQAAEANRNN